MTLAMQERRQAVILKPHVRGDGFLKTKANPSKANAFHLGQLD